MNKERNQNPVIGDTVNLKMFFYNSNYFATPFSINEVRIYYLDPNEVTCTNLEGRVLIETIPSGDVINVSDGEYEVQLLLNPVLYTNTGRYVDVWDVTLESTDVEPSLFENIFVIYPDLWYTTPLPVVYEFDFYFQPNKIRYGSKIYLAIDAIANTPRATDLENYYFNLVTASKLYVYIGSHCNPCNTCEDDNLVVDGELTPFTDKNRAFFQINTEDFDCGLYDIWFKLEFGGNIYVSPKNQLLIYS